jgi:hypothetical protein
MTSLSKESGVTFASCSFRRRRRNAHVSEFNSTIWVFAVRLTLYEFLLGRWFIWINIKHPTKGVNQLYPIAI